MIITAVLNIDENEEDDSAFSDEAIRSMVNRKIKFMTCPGTIISANKEEVIIGHAAIIKIEVHNMYKEYIKMRSLFGDKNEDARALIEFL